MTASPDWLAQRARTHAHRGALYFEERVFSFAELAAAAALIDARLQALGAKPGDRIGVLVGNRPELVELVHAIPRRRRTLVPLGTRLSAAEVADLIERSGCRLVVYDESTKKTVSAARAVHEFAAVCIDDPLPGDAGLQDTDEKATELLPTEFFSTESLSTDTWPTIELNDIHSIVFTSGSSGQPKGVLLSWNNHLWSALGSAFNLGVREDDRWLACMPLHHVGGLSILLRGVLSGTAVEMQPHFDPQLVNRAIDRGHVTLVSFVANMLQRVLEDRSFRPFPPSLRCVLLGGGPAPESLLQRSRELGVPLAPTYGMTETASQIATATPSDGIQATSGRPPVATQASGRPPVATQASGRPLLGAEVQIVDPDGAPVEPSQSGEIRVRGPIVSPGYLGERHRDESEWLSTGDVGFIRDGQLHVIGRADDTVISGGENIHPSEIERVLEAHPAVEEACAFGVADEQWGQRLEACVRIRRAAEVDESELRQHCAEHLARFKVPRQIAIVDQLARTGSGKIARRRVAEQHLQALTSPGKSTE